MARLGRNQSERDLGYVGIMRELGRLENLVVDTGIQADAGENDGTPIVEYAFYNEYGTRSIPERSFLRATFDDQIGQIIATRDKLVTIVLTGRMRAPQAARLMGEYHEAQIKQKIGSGVPPPNAPSTVRMKGSSKTLIDTGEMRQAVRYEVRNVGSDNFLRFARRLLGGRK